MTANDLRDHFNQTHAEEEDPWSVTTKWYEVRKRALLLASLPEPKFSRVLEIGCSTGVLSRALAERADEVIGLDFSVEAVKRATARAGCAENLTFVVGDAVDAFPDGAFDLIVISEVGYYLDTPRLFALADLVRASLTPAGVVTLCHWRHFENDFVQTGDNVHANFRDRIGFALMSTHVEDDFLLDVLSRDARGVSARSALV